ncbi:MAG: DUF2709 domain-containing protein [Chlamydiales bacterium]|nr:DUF2709 domain-containing protein [Chlamydiales bacterium]
MKTEKINITKDLKKSLISFLTKHKTADLLTTYLFYVEKKFEVHPVVFLKEKKIYRSEEELVDTLEKQGKLWRETEIKIMVGQRSVNEHTKRIYICPYSGKVFGDNTHPNPLDAIYDWVSRCAENTERKGGLPAKKFLVSEDPEVIHNYIEKRKEPITKLVFSSVISGKLFNSRKSVIDDFCKNHLKPISLMDVPTQNKFQIEDDFMNFIQEQIDESNMSAFVEAMSQEDELTSFTEHWFEEE